MRHNIKKLILSTLFFTIINIFAQEEDEFFTPSSTIGGYGELHYNYSKQDEGESKKTLDFHRFVMFYSHQWTEKWSFKAELELEHNFVQGEDKGELELEQAYVDYHHSDAFGFRAGVVLVGAGLLNEFHEPPLFLSVERPDYNKNIIPTTWFGNGITFYGQHKGFDYSFTFMEGLNADKFSAKGIRSARQKGFKSNAEDLLYNLRADYLGINGLKIGGSFTYNNATGTEENNAVNLIEVHAKYDANNFIIVGEYGNISYDKGEVESSRGFYLDLGYNIGSLLELQTEVIPFLRYSDYNTAANTLTGGDSEKQYHNKKIMFGVAVKPIDSVVFKVDYAVNNVELNDVDTKLFNIGVGYMF